MGRGLFAGMAWGALVGLLTIALASQLTHRRELVPAAPQTAEVEVPGGSGFDAARPDTDPILPATDAAPAGGEAVTVAAPEVPQAPPAVPDPAPAAPSAEASAPEPAPAIEAPATAEVAAPAPDAAPGSEAAPMAAETPAAEAGVAALPQPSPVAPPAEVAQPSAPAAASGTADAVVPSASDPARASAASPGPAPVAPAAPPAAVAGAVLAPVAPEVPESAAALPRSAEERPAGALAAAAPPPVPGSDAPPAGAAAAPMAPPAEPVQAEAPAAPSAPPADAAAARDTGIPAPGFAGAEGVRVNRLPTIGADAPAAEDAAPEPEGETAEAAPDPDAPALVRNAIAFENPDLRPVVAVILFHDAPAPPGAGTGRDLPVPVSFAVDAGLVEAGTVAEAYRAAGREILIVPTLPPGAAATDVEVALQVNLDVMPDAVALMDLPEGGFQSEREAVAQVVSAAARTGHGLVTFPRGLNMAQQMADRAGVPARPVFRMLEAGNADAALRTLDQAAFRARQEGAVILVGEAEPATVEAIRRWSEANAGGDVLFAPISAALAAGE